MDLSQNVHGCDLQGHRKARSSILDPSSLWQHRNIRPVRILDPKISLIHLNLIHVLSRIFHLVLQRRSFYSTTTTTTPKIFKNRGVIVNITIVIPVIVCPKQQSDCLRYYRTRTVRGAEYLFHGMSWKESIGRDKKVHDIVHFHPGRWCLG